MQIKKPHLRGVRNRKRDLELREGKRLDRGGAAGTTLLHNRKPTRIKINTDTTVEIYILRRLGVRGWFAVEVD